MFLSDLDIFFRHFSTPGLVNKLDRIYKVVGILDKEYVEVGEVSTYAPIFTIKTEDIENGIISVSQEIVINAINYTVVDLQSDGTGISKVVLHKTDISDANSDLLGIPGSNAVLDESKKYLISENHDFLIRETEYQNYEAQPATFLSSYSCGFTAEVVQNNAILDEASNQIMTEDSNFLFSESA